jgi:uncharacterized protein YdeI (BOF family)
VTGLVDDDPWPMPLEVYASSITTATGERVDLTGGETLETPARSREAAMPIRRPNAPTAIAALRPHETALIEGVVDRVLDEDEFRLRDDSGSIRVYVGWRNRVPAAPGDRVTVLGVVDADGPGGLFREVYASEITLPGGRVVRLQSAMSSPAEEPAVERLRAEAVGTVIPISQVRRGQRVTLAGVVDRIRDSDEFILRDDTGRIEIYIGWRNAMPVSMGERVTVFGVADDDVFPGRRPDVYADRILREDGSLVTFDRRDE